MKTFPISKIAGKFFILGFLLFNIGANAQQEEYRITDDGKYEYLNDPVEAGMIYDESNGSYYKPITIRTFFLEAQRNGYIAADISYPQFVKLPIILQIAAVNQPLAEVIDCSTNYTSPKCLKFIDLVLIVPDHDSILIVPIIGLAKLPLTQLENAKLFIKHGQKD